MCELRAVGKSPKPERAESGAYWTQARDVESLREHLGQERLTIIGHDAGTRLAISYAAQYPGRVARLLLVTPPSTYLVDEPADAAERIGERSGDPVFDKAVAAFQGGADLSDETAFNAWQQACAPMGVRRLDGSRTEARTTGEVRPRRGAGVFQRAATGRSGRKARCGEGAGEAFPER
ncbi:alpha/beta hydrolase [Streptomyces sp. HC44]|uniref:Alpha/beta hydrolase n=1 Tax=Streptomyces scabichelini TaxID=2711217 RepID=A0A6G4V933_9ACTN|nr:alpha/beta hydrolase [Streptomyces scabichelini]